jgi:hypothetical protein
MREDISKIALVHTNGSSTRQTISSMRGLYVLGSTVYLRYIKIHYSMMLLCI